uniref:Uncharacterized protein n=1 Tax=Arion vulgaris TaxID=1028688 RepID=A0A0B6Z2U3_9EUPU
MSSVCNVAAVLMLLLNLKCCNKISLTLKTKEKFVIILQQIQYANKFHRTMITQQVCNLIVKTRQGCTDVDYGWKVYNNSSPFKITNKLQTSPKSQNKLQTSFVKQTIPQWYID